jgi:predicted CoA-binding protein
VKALYVVTPKRRSNELIDSIIQRGFEVVWLQQASDTPEMINRLAEANIPVVSKECIFMHINPVGVHKFHRAVIKFFKPKAFC